MIPVGPNAEATTETGESAARVLVAGATGYIGRHIVEALHDAGYRVRVRNEAKLEPVAHACDEVVIGDAIDPDSLNGICDGVDVVVSALGLRTLRRRPTADDVDRRANLNVLKCAQASGVGQFVFVGVLDGEAMMAEVPILRPREQFVSELRQPGLTWSVIRPTGAFNDAAEAFRIAQRLRPLRLPGWTLDAAASVLRLCNGNAAGFLRFFRHTLSRDMVSNPVGRHHLADFFGELATDQ